MKRGKRAGRKIQQIRFLKELINEHLHNFSQDISSNINNISLLQNLERPSETHLNNTN